MMSSAADRQVSRTFSLFVFLSDLDVFSFLTFKVLLNLQRFFRFIEVLHNFQKFFRSSEVLTYDTDRSLTGP